MAETGDRELVARARSMFEFLREVQRLRSKNPTTVAQYARDGFAYDTEELLEPAAGYLLDSPALEGEWVLAKPLVIVPRLSPRNPPLPPRSVAPFLRGDQSDPKRDLDISRELRDAADQHGISPELESLLSGATPEQMLHAAETYVIEWEDWASTEKLANGVRSRYQELFRAQEDATTDAQSWEFLLGVGRVRMPANGERAQIDRPILTVPVTGAARRRDGALEVSIPADARFRLELDMIPPGELVSPDAREELEGSICSIAASNLTLTEVSDAVQGFVNTGLREATFVAEKDFFQKEGTVAAVRPIVIKRKRSSLATVAALDAVVKYLQGAHELPPGLAAIVDPQFAAAVPDEDTHAPDGGVVTRGEGQFTPLPVNVKQWNVIKRVDTRPLTLVQGPPGTGKTHTTAALISHLLAQGKRILVTAHNPEALGEVRVKLPAEIQSLAVSVVGAGQQGTTDLRAAINGISRKASDFDREANESEIECVSREIERFLDEREKHVEDLLRSRSEESEVQNTPFGSQTLAELAKEWRDGRDRYTWAGEYMPDPGSAPVELGLAEVPQIQRALVEVNDRARAAEVKGILGAIGDAPLPDDIDQVMSDSDRLSASLERHLEGAHLGYVRQAEQSENDVIASTRDHVQQALDLLDGLRNRPEQWVEQALRDITFGKHRAWSNRNWDVDQRIQRANELLATFRQHEPLVMTGDSADMRKSLGVLLGWLDAAGEVKHDGAGRPKLRMRAPKPVKEAWHLWGDFSVRGRPATDRAALDALSTFFLLEDELMGLDAAWPAGTLVSEEDSAAERIAWHEDEAGVLREVLEVPALYASADAAVSALPGDYSISWTDRTSVVAFLDSLSVVLVRRQLETTEKRIQGFRARIMELGDCQILDSLFADIGSQDTAAYRAHIAELASEIEFRDRCRAAHRSLEGVRERLPKIAAVLPVAGTSEWLERFPFLERAWHWVRLDAWLRNQASLDPNRIQEQISGVDSVLEDRIGKLAALRAWGKAVDRLTPDRRADLQAYVSLIKRLGKGKGKYASSILAEIQPVLARCRPSVPVWIMPLYRVFESQEMKPNSFDVVIIDEASQASLDALILMFLAPKVVVVGDDKQVSPSAVGLNQEPIQQLVESFLGWSPQKAVYKDPARSLFDEARMRFPDLIALTEHRRCVPEIIGFSDEIAYRDDEVPLEPVREAGASALPPLVTTFVDDGLIDKRSKVNSAEQDAILAEIQSCINDPAYDGKTLGVISLLGSKQAQGIEQQLREELPPEEFEDRDIRCGEAPNFQGAERDVIFLSMVIDAETRSAPLTALQYVQRFNVAASRARDQLHLFHSVGMDHLTNDEDMRHKLLEYMLRNAEKGTLDMEPSEPVEPVAYDPDFPSDLSREIYNFLAELSYKVIPQYPVLGRPTDLVVVGTNGKVAVQCIHSNPVDEEDLRKTLDHERELLRVGWKIHRVRQSSLAIREEETKEELLAFLTGHGIEPMTTIVAASEDDDAVNDIDFLTSDLLDEDDEALIDIDFLRSDLLDFNLLDYVQLPELVDLYTTGDDDPEMTAAVDKRVAQAMEGVGLGDELGSDDVKRRIKMILFAIVRGEAKNDFEFEHPDDELHWDSLADQGRRLSGPWSIS